MPTARLGPGPAFGHAVRLGLLATNPATSNLLLPRIERREMTVWLAEEARRFLEVTADDPLGPLWRLILTTGLGRGEALGLRWVDVDLELRRLSVSQSLVMVRGRPTMSTPKGEPRQVSLPQTTADALRRYRVRRDKDRPLAGPAWSDSSLVFTTALGGPLDPNNVYDRFIDSYRGAGVPVIRLHDGRHTAATLALEAGAHPKLVQEMLGHASIEMTLDTYSHVVPGMHREVSDRIEAVLNDGNERSPHRNRRSRWPSAYGRVSPRRPAGSASGSAGRRLWRWPGAALRAASRSPWRQPRSAAAPRRCTATGCERRRTRRCHRRRSPLPAQPAVCPSPARSGG